MAGGRASGQAAPRPPAASRRRGLRWRPAEIKGEDSDHEPPQKKQGDPDQDKQQQQPRQQQQQLQPSKQKDVIDFKIMEVRKVVAAFQAASPQAGTLLKSVEKGPDRRWAKEHNYETPWESAMTSPEELVYRDINAPRIMSQNLPRMRARANADNKLVGSLDAAMELKGPIDQVFEEIRSLLGFKDVKDKQAAAKEHATAPQAGEAQEAGQETANVVG